MSDSDLENPSSSARTSANHLQSQSFMEQFDDDDDNDDLAVESDRLDNSHNKNKKNKNRSSKKRKDRSRWFWKRQIKLAREHGGDYGTRITTAARTALGSGLMFSTLVFPDRTDLLGMVWVGNIWYHVNISNSFGASLTSVLYFARSTIITTVVFSWPLALLFNYLKHEGNNHRLVNILFPIAIFGVSFLILTCPQLTSNTLMVVVMFIVVAAPIANPMYWLKPFGWVATYFICLAIAVLMNVAPFPNFALHTTRNKLKQLERDLTMLLLAIKEYSNNNGTNLKLARKAISTMEFKYTRIFETINTLQEKLPAALVELKLKTSCFGGSGGGGRCGQDLVEWVQHSKTLLEPLKHLRSALVQKVLGEESTFSSPSLARAKVVLNQEISPSRDRLVDATVSSIALCHTWADPTKHDPSAQHQQQREELRTALQECKRSFHKAICKAADEIGSKGSCHQSSKEQQSLFAHLTRRMSAFHSLFALAENIVNFLEQHNNNEEIQSRPSSHKKPCCRHLFQWCSMIWAFCRRPWKWRNPDELQMAIKTSMGMVLAALFVSIPYLKDVSAPYGIWPGITVASISMPSRGSSFIKAADRLMATMIGGAFSLLVADFFPGNRDSVKIGALTVFSFIMIYLRDKNHAYMFTYSCITIGCMLFGSGASDYDISGYVPKRIELIFVGVLIFGFVELLLFPRSSRKIVEGAALDFILSTRDFLKQAVKCSEQMETFVNQSGCLDDNQSDCLDDKSTVYSNEKPFDLSELAKAHAKLKAHSSKLAMETGPAISEPSLGFGMPLHASSFRRLVANETATERQAALLCNALGTLATYYQQGGHPIRDLNNNWPHVHTGFLRDVADCMDTICDLLDAAFVDGRIRAQEGNSVEAVNAAATFRSLEDVRLKIVSEWSDSFQKFVHQNGFDDSDPHAMMTLGITTTVIMEMCEQMQQAGRNLEEIAYRFPEIQ
eukprot:scaffold1239_cov130-Cylindrotheca_fusiformis.AAC.2